MGQHDDYAKRLMGLVCGKAYHQYGSPVEVDLGTGRPARIDGVVDSRIGVEIESRVSKQVRGALLDLALHNSAKKLLVLMPVHMHDIAETKAQSEFIMRRIAPSSEFGAVVLSGNGDNHREEADMEIIRDALESLGWKPSNQAL